MSKRHSMSSAVGAVRMYSARQPRRRRKNNSKGIWRQQFVPLFEGKGKKRTLVGHKTISHRLDGQRQSDMMYN
jgi:hypothetical protein